MTSRRFQLYAVMTGLILLLFVLFCSQQFAKGRAAAFEAATDLQICRTLAGRIKNLKELPAQAGLRQVAKGELDKQMEDAAHTAGFPTIVAITPDLPRRLESTVYMEQSTEVLLKQVTLAQVVDFLYTLCSRTPGLRVASLRLTMPRETETAAGTAAPEAAGRWTAQITVSYRYYAPQNTTVRAEP